MPAGFLIPPELDAQFLGGLSRASFGFNSFRLQLRGITRAVILLILRVELPAIGERFAALGPQLFVFIPPHVVHRLAQIFAHMKLVMHHVQRRALVNMLWLNCSDMSTATARTAAFGSGRNCPTASQPSPSSDLPLTRATRQLWQTLSKG